MTQPVTIMAFTTCESNSQRLVNKKNKICDSSNPLWERIVTKISVTGTFHSAVFSPAFCLPTSPALWPLCDSQIDFPGLVPPRCSCFWVAKLWWQRNPCRRQLGVASAGSTTTWTISSDPNLWIRSSVLQRRWLVTRRHINLFLITVSALPLLWDTAGLGARW